MKYTLNTYGWSFEVICKSLTDEQVQTIKDKMDEESFSELHEIRFDLDELLDLDFSNGEILHKTEAFDNGTMYFEIIDEVGNTLMGFTMNEVGDLYETIEDYDDKYEYQGYELIPQYNKPPTNLYLSIDENKGGIFKFEFETDTAPLPSDFTYSTGSIDTPDGEYDFVDKIFFKGQPLDSKDYLDNSGKSSSVMIFTLDGETIN